MSEQVSANKTPHGKKDALALASGAKKLIAARGTKIAELDLRAKPPAEEILALMLGPSGKLRAPTMRVGDTLYVGFPRGGFEGLK